MTKISKIQQELFHLLKSISGKDKGSFAEEISKTLHISQDGVYRRLRGETVLTLEDLRLINKKFPISLDPFLNGNSNGYFTTDYKSPEEFNLSTYLENMIHDLEPVSKDPGFKITFNSKELPIFHLFHFPELMEFKSFFWQKTFLKKGEFQDKRFEPTGFDEYDQKKIKKVVDAFSRIHSIELWHDDVLNSTIKQIEFYYESGVMHLQVATRLLNKLKDLVDLIERQADIGHKFLDGNDIVGGSKFDMYYNEVVIGDNTLLLTKDTAIKVFLTQNVVSTLLVTDQKFSVHTQELLENLKKNSILISNTAERVRRKYFNLLRNKVEKSLWKIA